MTDKEKKTEISNRQRFNKICAKRISNTLHNIELIGNCSNLASYEYTADDIVKFQEALVSEINKTVGRFSAALKKGPSAKVEKPSFKF